jgi:glutamate synthase (ferredoxin)
MTGGRVVVLGGTGLNFAAGMSGGIAYVLDEAGDFAGKCNPEMVDLDPVETDADIAELLDLVERHQVATGSEVAARIMADWPEVLARFVKVMPRDYKRVLAERQQHDEEIDSDVHDEKATQTAVGN